MRITCIVSCAAADYLAALRLDMPRVLAERIKPQGSAKPLVLESYNGASNSGNRFARGKTPLTVRAIRAA